MYDFIHVKSVKSRIHKLRSTYKGPLSDGKYVKRACDI